MSGLTVAVGATVFVAVLLTATLRLLLRTSGQRNAATLCLKASRTAGFFKTRRLWWHFVRAAALGRRTV
jgi:D-alanyl-D-alanine dipeptidase